MNIQAQKTFNPKVGINVSSIGKLTLDTAEFSGNIGWNIGVNYRYGDRTFAFCPGLHYYRQAMDVKGKIQMQDYKDANKVDYLKVPLGFDVLLTKEGGFLALHGKAGAVPTFLLGTRSNDHFAFNKSLLKTFVIGAEVGLEADILTFFTVGMKYEFGLSDVFKEKNTKMKTATLSVGVRF